MLWRYSALVLAILVGAAWLPAAAQAEVPGFEGGHLKGRWLTSTYPDDSLFRDSAGAVTHDQAGSLRLKFSASPGAINLGADYQLFGQHGDSLELVRDFQDLFLVPAAVPDDEHRWWDLTHEISSSNSSVLVQRLDRLHIGYTGEKTVLRFGRQAVSWGNGLIYNPMDFFNPFDPAAVDTEYKIGDDMLYGQYLLNSGDDWQFVNVQRRDDSGDVTSKVSSTALKYHSFGLEQEFDLLVAQHFDEFMAAVGGALNVGDSVLRGDLVFTDAEQEWVTTAVASWSYSWVWAGYNVSGVAEYFFNGFGLRQSQYGPDDIREAQDLVERINRGELFTLGRHYLAASLMVEMSPLVHLTPNLFWNLGDDSALAQLVAQWDVGQNWQLLGAVNVPIGPSGTEYGGLETGLEELTLSTGPGLFVQVAWYF